MGLGLGVRFGHHEWPCCNRRTGIYHTRCGLGVKVVEAVEAWRRGGGRRALEESVESARQNSPKWSAPDLSSLYRETTRRSSGYIATSAIAHTSSASTRPSPSLSRSAKRWERLSSSGALKCVLDASSFITAAVGGGARGTAAASVAALPRRRPICGCERARRLGEVPPASRCLPEFHDGTNTTTKLSTTVVSAW